MAESNNQDEQKTTVYKSSDRGFWETLKLFSRQAFLVLVLFVLAIVGLAFFSAPSVSRVAGGFIDDFQAGECEEMYENSTDYFKQDPGETRWLNYCSQISDVLQGNVDEQSVNINTDAEGKKIGSVIYNILGTDGYSYEVFIEILDDNGWKLSTFAYNLPEPTTEED